MRGHELIEELNTHFRVIGTAGKEPLVKDIHTGIAYRVLRVTTEYLSESDPDFPVRHWIEVEAI